MRLEVLKWVGNSVVWRLVVIFISVLCEGRVCWLSEVVWFSLRVGFLFVWVICSWLMRLFISYGCVWVSGGVVLSVSVVLFLVMVEEDRVLVLFVFVILVFWVICCWM